LDNVTALLDASVLYPAPLRDLLMELAVSDLYRAKWSDAVHEEWIRAVLQNRPDLTRAQLERTRDLMNAHAVEMVNERVSDLGEYKTVAEAGVYFATGQSALDAAAKADLDKLAQIALSTEHYMIEVAGYASSTGTQSENQRLSDQRATSVVQYLRNKGNIPMRRFLVPAGYGENKPAATNTDAQGRALNQRVDVKVIVNKGLSQGM